MKLDILKTNGLISYSKDVTKHGAYELKKSNGKLLLGAYYWSDIFF
jgi:hypothetical protein